jgi:predicted MFS family arabinose efflux permease
MNNTGDWVLNVALPIYVFIETGSGSATALLFVCQLVVAALGPFGGAVVDRLDLQSCLVATNLAQAVAVLPLFTVSQDRIWPAYIVVVTQAALTQVNNPANVALVPRVVHPDQLTKGNAALAASASLARLLGVPIGGLLVTWPGLGPIAIIDATTFVLVAASFSWLRSDTSPSSDPDAGEQGRVRAGLRSVRTHAPLAPLLSIHGVAQIAQGGFVVLFVAFMIDVLEDDGAELGLIRGTMAIGALAGSLLIGRLARHLHPATLYSAGLVGMGLVSALFWNAPTVSTALAVYIVLFTLSGIPGSAVQVLGCSTLRSACPNLRTAAHPARLAEGVAAASLLDSNRLTRNVASSRG